MNGDQLIQACPLTLLDGSIELLKKLPTQPFLGHVTRHRSQASASTYILFEVSPMPYSSPGGHQHTNALWELSQPT